MNVVFSSSGVVALLNGIASGGILAGVGVLSLLIGFLVRKRSPAWWAILKLCGVLFLILGLFGAPNLLNRDPCSRTC
jgi:membrane-bound ClpP family serine protease